MAQVWHGGKGPKVPGIERLRSKNGGGGRCGRRRRRQTSRARGTSTTTRPSPGSSPPPTRLAPLAPPCGTAAW
eukprot:1422006-Prymnesium_polylepis.1